MPDSKSETTPAPVVQVARYIDAIDAIDAHMHVNRWIEGLAGRLPPGASIESYGLRFDDPTALPNGGVTVVWGEPGRMAGIATIVRDPCNWSRLTIVERAT
jgi:hypothetical protein